MTKRTVRKRGGQEKAPAERKRNNLTFRTRDRLYERLEQAAAASGRSVSEEIEHRLEHSFLEGRSLLDALTLAYGSPHAGMLLLIAETMKAAGTTAATIAHPGKLAPEWIDHAYAFHQAVCAAEKILVAAAPEGDVTPPTNLFSGQIPELGLDLDQIKSNAGVGVAVGMLTEVASGNPIKLSSGERTQMLRRLLGAPIIQRIAKFLEQ